MTDITRVGIIGAGLMGSGIAEVCARAGLDVVVRETDDTAAAAGRARITGSLNRGVKAGKLTQLEHDAALERVTVTTCLSGLADRDLVIEAATENPMGPLRLADLIGLDTLQAISDSMYAEHAEPLYAAPPLLRRMTAAGLLGRKMGRGFYEYSDQPGDGAGR